jgi:hypothetical protein
VAKELNDLIEKKNNIEGQLAKLENQIYNLESGYLQDTAYLGIFFEAPNSDKFNL